jgi:hypothetical protein
MVRCVNRLRGCFGRVETRGKNYKSEFNEIFNDVRRNDMEKRELVQREYNYAECATSNISGMVWL